MLIDCGIYEIPHHVRHVFPHHAQRHKPAVHHATPVNCSFLDGGGSALDIWGASGALPHAAVTPEPATWLLLAVGFAFAVTIGRRSAKCSRSSP